MNYGAFILRTPLVCLDNKLSFLRMYECICHFYFSLWVPSRKYFCIIPHLYSTGVKNSRASFFRRAAQVTTRKLTKTAGIRIQGKVITQPQDGGYLEKCRLKTRTAGINGANLKIKSFIPVGINGDHELWLSAALNFYNFKIWKYCLYNTCYRLVQNSLGRNSEQKGSNTTQNKLKVWLKCFSELIMWCS